ncbi:MAG TPA: ornithine cyclodeaminase family protein [Methylomirabilota bacterium]|nr:ornithine cyclodeaminase family protein [Methylomirabilota bacterium]
MDEHRIRYLSRRDVEELDLGMPAVVDAVEQAFREKGRGRAVMPAKHWLAPSERRFYSAMTSVVPEARAAGCKWQSGSSDNAARGLPYITGLLILNDSETGLPLAVMDSTWITAMRTGAATAVTARYLARPGIESFAMLGCGVQGRRHVEALRVVFPGLRRVHAYDIDPDALHRYAREVGERHGLEVIACPSAREAVRGAPLVVTAGPIEPNRPRTIDADWLEPGMLGVGIDYDCYWRPAALRAADKLYADDRTQLEHLRESGYFRDSPPLTAEIGDVVAGKAPGRERADEVIIAMTMGISVEDVTTARRVYDLAVTRGRGTLLPL